jgi:hypothetical protein
VRPRNLAPFFWTKFGSSASYLLLDHKYAGLLRGTEHDHQEMLPLQVSHQLVKRNGALALGYTTIMRLLSRPQAKLRRATDPVIQKGRASANLLLSLACPLLPLLRELECETGSPIDLNRVVLGTINEIVAGLAKDSDMRCETVF